MVVDESSRVGVKLAVSVDFNLRVMVSVNSLFNPVCPN